MKKQVKWLAKKIQQMQSGELQKLREENAELRVGLETVTRQKDELAKQLSEMNVQYEKLGGYADSLEDRVAKVQDQNIALEQQAMMFADSTPTQEQPAKKRTSRKKVETEA